MEYNPSITGSIVALFTLSVYFVLRKVYLLIEGGHNRENRLLNSLPSISRAGVTPEVFAKRRDSQEIT